MKYCAALLFSMMLVACASTPVAPPTDRLFNDRLFAGPSERVSADDVFALSAAMKRFLSTEIAGQKSAKGQRQVLVDALYAKDQLKLDYDTVMTRNAAQAFDAHVGNCLSLVIMTAAFAREMGLPIRYQNVNVEEVWSRSGDVYFSIGHVNLALGRGILDGPFWRGDSEFITIDFLPEREIRGARTRAIGEETIVSMYMNNRAAELLVDGKLDDAYWWARAAITHDPAFSNPYNTLGVIYKRHGNPAEAEKVLTYALAREPSNTKIMSNLVSVLNTLGRTTEAQTLASKLELLEPSPPFAHLNRGMTALRSGDYTSAREQFAKEVARSPYNDELHYWLAVAYVGLGETEAARAELAKALEYSTTRKSRDMYAAKLDRVRASQTR